MTEPVVSSCFPLYDNSWIWEQIHFISSSNQFHFVLNAFDGSFPISEDWGSILDLYVFAFDYRMSLFSIFRRAKDFFLVLLLMRGFHHRKINCSKNWLHGKIATIVCSFKTKILNNLIYYVIRSFQVKYTTTRILKAKLRQIFRKCVFPQHKRFVPKFYSSNFWSCPLSYISFTSDPPPMNFPFMNTRGT